MQWIDTHSHLFVEEFNEDLEATVQRAKEAGLIAIYMPNIDVESLPALLKACTAYPGYLFPTVGLHPTSVDDDYTRALETLKASLKEGHPFVAIGEVGMDLYWDKTFLLQQQKALDEQIQWALTWDLPMVIHCRDAYQEMYEVFAPYIKEPLRGVFHCFSGSAEDAERYLAFENFFLGVNGSFTYKKSVLPEVFKQTVPLNRVVLETDSPYLAPVPHRGRRNESAYLVDVARKVAEVYGTDLEQISVVTTRNAQILYGVGKS